MNIEEITTEQKERILFFEKGFNCIVNNYSNENYYLHFNKHIRGYSFSVLQTGTIKTIFNFKSIDCTGKPLVHFNIDFGGNFLKYDYNYILNHIYNTLELKYQIINK